MNTKRNINIFDIIIIVIALSITIFFLTRGMNEDASKITVECNGETYRYSLDKDQTVTLEGAIGPTVLEIKDHKVAITSSPCKNQICVHTGWVSKPNSFIVCVPGKILVTVEGSEKLEIDDVAR